MLTISIIFLITSNAITSRRDKSVLYARTALIILILSTLICANTFYIEFFENSLGLFGGFYQATAITHLFHIFIFIVTAVILQLNAFYPRKIWTPKTGSLISVIKTKLSNTNNFIINKMKEQYTIIEYPLIILFVVMGGCLLLSSSDLISIFLSVELQSYGLYILCAVYRNSERSTSSALTYFLLGGLSSCFILLAAGLIYTNSGNTSVDGIYLINYISNIQNDVESLYKYTYLYDSYYVNFSMVILSIGFLFKVSAAPFHFWSPDVYDGIPTIVTTFVAVFAKISIFILLLELVHYTSDNLITPDYVVEKHDHFLQSLNFSWTFTLLISSFMSLIIGAVLGLTQHRIKRLYAYSTISHIGFILLALTINTVESIQSFIFYLLQYSLSNLNAFILLIYIGYSLYFYVEKSSSEGKNTANIVVKDKTTSAGLSNLTYSSENVVNTGQSYLTIQDKTNSPVQFVNQLKGYFFINPILGISFSLTIFSFVGIPPLIGFFAKQMVLSSAMYNGYVFMSFIAILSSVISAYYYLALVKQIFFHDTNYEINPLVSNISLKTQEEDRFSSTTKDINYKIQNVYLTSSLSVSISVLTLIILVFIFIPQEWLNLANMLSLILFSY